MKRNFIRMMALALVTAMTLSGAAFAAPFRGVYSGEATFETLEEARISAPIFVQQQDGNTTMEWASYDILDNYPQGAAWVYRSSDYYVGRAAPKANSCITVFAEKTFASKDQALSYLKDLGLVDIIEEVNGSVILVTPADPEQGFTEADQKNYYILQTAIFSIDAGRMEGETKINFAEFEYLGAFSHYYVIGIDGGATFINNYVAGTLDYVSRIAGMLLINGKMERVRKVAGMVPVYLVNADETTIAKYKEANGVDALICEGDKATAYNQQFPVRRVSSVTLQTVDEAAIIKDAWYNLMVKGMRASVLPKGLITASTPYQGYPMDNAPFALCDRNALFDYVTADGVHYSFHDEKIFSDIKTSTGEFMDDWFEYVPEEVLNGTAEKHSIPLLLLNHGGGEMPSLFVDQMGYLKLAGDKRLAIVAPEHQTMTDIVPQTAPALVRYMLDKYPALDPSRVYVSGYSWGGGASYRSVYGDPSVFAAAYPMAGTIQFADESMEANFKNVDLPICFNTSEYDSAWRWNREAFGLHEDFVKLINNFLRYNEMETLPESDFETYPVVGFKADAYRADTVNDQFKRHSWYLNNDAGIPMVAFEFVENIVHANYPPYSEMFWEFVKHYSRNQETGEIMYNPYVD